MLAAAHLLRYGEGPEVAENLRDVGEISWLIFLPDREDAAAELLSRVHEKLAGWPVARLQAYAAGLPKMPLLGVPDAWPHVASALAGAGYRPAHEDHRGALYGGPLAGVARVGETARARHDRSPDGRAVRGAVLGVARREGTGPLRVPHGPRPRRDAAGPARLGRALRGVRRGGVAQQARRLVARRDGGGLAEALPAATASSSPWTRTTRRPAPAASTAASAGTCWRERVRPVVREDGLAALGLLDLPRRLHHHGRQPLARMLPEPGDRTARAHGRPQSPVGAEDRGAHARHADLPLGHALGPAPAPGSRASLRDPASSSDHARSTLPAEPCSERQHRAHGHRVPQAPARPLHGGHAHPAVPLPHVELRALPGPVPERREDWGGGPQIRPDPAAPPPQPSSRNPSAYRPSSRATSPCVSSAVKSLYAVGRASPVPRTTPARRRGPVLGQKGQDPNRLVQNPDPALAPGRASLLYCPYVKHCVSYVETKQGVSVGWRASGTRSRTRASPRRRRGGAPSFWAVWSCGATRTPSTPGAGRGR